MERRPDDVVKHYPEEVAWEKVGFNCLQPRVGFGLESG